ncbi:nuclear transport factor 2 family protein [Breznakia pachnodae]|uniref:SnoaL-like domain-containing protein n=1 Tax=Breznakia pachnodae TaxID=265178 RepID=A0ABU0E1G8_9FIRM|nr:nuclear transport factor 2 family protein [Breznakia pachnodae]MDQ0360656.1 hypothetical protein [Breznakia pachnodae]
MSRKIIKEIFDTFINGLEKNKFDCFDINFADNVEFETTIFGNFSNIETAKEIFKWKGPDLDYSRYRLFNNSVFTNDKTGIQSVYVVALVGYEKDNYFHYLQFGGRYLVYYEKSGLDWKIAKLKYGLDMIDGNTSFVSDWWKLMDFTIYNGYKNYPINSNIEAPWRNYDYSDEWSEKEKIMDVYNRYAWGIDYNDFEITKSVLSENVFSDIQENSIYGRESLIQMFKQKRNKENLMSHVGYVDKITIDENKAIMTVFRHEPHRIGTNTITKDNKDTMFYTVNYTFYLKKIENNWITDKIVYDIGVFGINTDVKP